MASAKANSANRNTERIFLLLITIVMSVLFYKLYTVLSADFAEVPSRLEQGTMMNLNNSKPGDSMKTLLQKGRYFRDEKDIDLISSTFQRARTLDTSAIENIGDLNKKEFNINADVALAQGGESFKRRVAAEQIYLGFTQDDSAIFKQQQKNAAAIPAANNAAMGSYSISGVIKNNSGAVPNVIVRAQLILPQDSVYSNKVEEVQNELNENTITLKKSYAVDSLNNKQLQSLIAYTQTDANGNFSFNGLPNNKAYEVQPLQPGFTFGRSQGVQQLDKNTSFFFYQSPHALKLFSTKDFNILKKEKSLIVRTPEDVQFWYWIIVAGFFAGFFLIHVFLSIRFKEADQLILPVIMILTGLSFLTLLSLQDPLRDRFLAKDTLYYFAGGIAAMVLLLLFNLKLFTTDSSFYRLFVFKKMKLAANGWPWAVIATGLLALTIFFGTGPEGSGVKVNLFGFQPSEIVKFAIVIFLAGFFATNEKFISSYNSWTKRGQFFAFALTAILATIFLFLILGDLGPAMVCCFTFIILFSFSRGDFIQMAGAVILYVLAVWSLKNVWMATGIVAGVLILFALIAKKRLSESTVMALVVIAAFLLLDQIPILAKYFPGPMQRLIDRKAIWQNPWNNEVFGGDQVANGIWAMSSGGVTGQGAGEGFAKTIPEAHTDMILPSMGEEFGWAGIIGVFILFLIYLHRSIVIGRHSGRPLLFYICAGIGVATFVQFILIAGGSTGALPLSGVALPFMSYGGSSLIANMVAAGFLLSTSHIHGSPAQMKYISAQDKNLIPALMAACMGIVLLSITVSSYLFENKKWVVQPALVADRSGARMFSYNPRISILMNRLQAGNLLDRNGLILATSHPQLINTQLDTLHALGITQESIDSLSYKRLDRYYPFSKQMFFWTGDANTNVFNGASNGYFSEYEDAPEMRGFPIGSTNFTVSATRFKEDRFLPQSSIEMTVVKRDYSALASLLVAGINSAAVDSFKQRNRDVNLTVDAALQTRIQNSLQTDDSLLNKRISVVVMEDNTGDVLASASYPLPPVNDWDMLTLTPSEQNKLPGWITDNDLGFTVATQPGSTAKLITALAAFNKLGIAAAKKVIHVYPQDLIRTKGYEPDEAGYINIETGLVRSNNSFFIRLANEEQLQEQMGTLYLQSGMFLHGVGGYYYDYDPNNIEQQNEWRDLWRKTEFQSVKHYDPNNIKRTRGRGVSGMAWGQGELIATPAAVARIASGIANNGIMIPNRFVEKINGKTAPVNKGVAIANDSAYAKLMTKYMIEQSALKVSKLGIAVAGKTGTPERILKNERINDGWYVFFAPKAKGVGHIVTCIRIENCKGSSFAVAAAGKHIVPILLQMGYIKSFDEKLNNKKVIEQNMLGLKNGSLNNNNTQTE
jgi:cell division protein FtsW (lipid II flippase)